MSKNRNFKAEGCIAVHSRHEALDAVDTNREIVIIGGARTYKEFLPIADRIYLTIMHNSFEGDAYFPEIGNEWKQTSKEFHKADHENPYDYEFLILERKKK